MIGNDIIDLVQSRKESNWRRRGFVSKLFDEQEQLLIVNSPDPEIVVWLLWSMKEAAYKIWNRQTGIRKYIPLKLRCSVHKRSSCKAREKSSAKEKGIIRRPSFPLILYIP